jgi:hypothetical protein
MVTRALLRYVGSLGTPTVHGNGFRQAVRCSRAATPPLRRCAQLPKPRIPDRSTLPTRIVRPGCMQDSRAFDVSKLPRGVSGRGKGVRGRPAPAPAGKSDSGTKPKKEDTAPKKKVPRGCEILANMPRGARASGRPPAGAELTLVFVFVWMDRGSCSLCRARRATGTRWHPVGRVTSPTASTTRRTATVSSPRWL